MTRLFRSKSCGFPEIVRPTELNKAAPSLTIPLDSEEWEEGEDEDKGEPDEKHTDVVKGSLRSRWTRRQQGQAAVLPGSRSVTCNWKNHNKSHRNYYNYNYQRSGHPDYDGGGHPDYDGGSKGSSSSSKNQQIMGIGMVDVLMAALRKSLITCSVEAPEDVKTVDSSIVDISWPTEVRHVSHVTFDRFNGFLGLPTELQPHVPKRVPSASASVFGVSAESMQCSFDERGNSVPTILLMVQRQLYSGGGLKVEGIFRINADNGQEEYVRKQLNRGVVPQGIDVHCLASMIKAWLRELPMGVLDTLTPDQLMCCNTEDECTQVLQLLPPMEAALLDWAINLMADVVQHETYNKMNARNIAMVFAPNMTQMADPLTALIHAVQVMNFLKTLILKTIREREECQAAKLYPHLGFSLFIGSDNDTNSDGGTLHEKAPNSNKLDDGTRERCLPESVGAEGQKEGIRRS